MRHALLVVTVLVFCACGSSSQSTPQDAAMGVDLAIDPGVDHARSDAQAIIFVGDGTFQDDVGV